jgi:hypothetical protein
MKNPFGQCARCGRGISRLSTLRREGVAEAGRNNTGAMPARLVSGMNVRAGSDASREDCSALCSVFTGEQGMRVPCSVPCKQLQRREYTSLGASRQVNELPHEKFPQIVSKHIWNYFLRLEKLVFDYIL